MASMTIRNIDDDTKKRLRLRAAANGHSVEAEARALLKRGVAEVPLARPKTGLHLYDEIRRIVEPLGGIELHIPPRTRIRNLPPLKAKVSDKRRKK
jgi:plasmid stability protein